MRTHGTIRYDAAGRQWVLAVEPDVMTRLKRLFEKIPKSAQGIAALSDSAENARELAWFMLRFPLVISDEDRMRLDWAAEEHKERESLIDRILAADYTPPAFADLAIPARDYQRLAAAMLLEGGSLLIGDDTGLGKTASAITALTDRRALPALVVTLTALPWQWQDEIRRFAPKLRTHVLRNGPIYDFTQARRGHGGGPPDVIITSYSKLAKWAGYLAKYVRGAVIFDECHELRHREYDGETSAKYAGAAHIAEHARYRCGMSATPTFGLGGQIWNVVEILRPGALGSWDEFRREWCKDMSRKPAVRDPDALGAYLRRSGIMLRRTRKEVGRELPPIQRIIQPVEANLDVLKHMETSAAELARIILMRGAAPEQKFKASGDLDWRLRQATGVSKAPFVADFVRLLLESGEKVLLYGYHHAVYAIWRERLKEFRPVFFTGEESAAEKREAKRRFCDPDAGEDASRLLIMNTRSGAGLDGLQYSGCHIVVYGELDWEHAVHHQGEDRINRDGQPEPVVVYYAVSDSGSDPVIADVLGLKRQALEGIRDPYAERVERAPDPEEQRARMKKLAEDFLRRHDPKALAALEAEAAQGDDAPAAHAT